MKTSNDNSLEYGIYLLFGDFQRYILLLGKYLPIIIVLFFKKLIFVYFYIYILFINLFLEYLKLTVVKKTYNCFVCQYYFAHLEIGRVNLLSDEWTLAS